MMTTTTYAATSPAILEKRLPERRYLPELHGLRGLALLGVVVFHLFGSGRVSGGIDIFLAVSGFLFTGMLLREAAASGGRIDPFKYFGRLVRRILVPAAIVIAATLALGLMVSPVTQHRQLWTEARASLLYFENFELISSQLAYGAAGPDTSPFQHFWSLSVQGQFYLIWPLVAIAAVIIAKTTRTSATRVMAMLIGTVFIASFAYAIYVGSYSQDEAYLLTTTRAWELAFGGLLALAGGALRLPKSLRGLAGWAGVFLIVTCGFFLDGGQLFPGPWALWPLAGLTLVLIAAGPTGGNNDPIWSATRFLSNKPLAWIGDHAYGLYLWHWPLLIFYMELRDRQAVGIRGAIVILAITVVLAILMHRYIERPLQRSTQRNASKQKRSNKTIVAIGASALVVSGLAMSAFTQPSELQTTYGDLSQDTHPGGAQHFVEGPIPDIEPFPAVENVDQYRQEYLNQGCHQVSGDNPGTDEVKVCEDQAAPENPTATIVLAGGSHAGHLEAGFKALARKYDWEVLVVLKSSCVFGWGAGASNDTCHQWNENFIEWLEEQDIDLVVTPGTRLDNTGDTETIVDAAPQWWDRISETQTDLLLMRGTPREVDSIPDCLARGGTAQQCGPSKDGFAETNPLLEVELPSNVYPLDMTEYVCPKIHDDTAANCNAIVGNIIVWFDRSHFSTPFSQSLAPGLEAEMEKMVPHLVR